MDMSKLSLLAECYQFCGNIQGCTGAVKSSIVSGSLRCESAVFRMFESGAILVEEVLRKRCGDQIGDRTTQLVINSISGNASQTPQSIGDRLSFS
eukprot:4241123-Pyramimonas_sp.AAC.1